MFVLFPLGKFGPELPLALDPSVGNRSISGLSFTFFVVELLKNINVFGKVKLTEMHQSFEIEITFVLN